MTLWNVLGSVWAYRFIRWTVAVFFLVAGVLKLADINAFTGVINAFAIAPSSVVDILAWALPVLEIIGALGLVFGMRTGNVILFLLLCLFLGVLVYAISIGLDVDCGCYGPEDPEGEVFHSLWTSLYRDFGLLAGVLYCIGWPYFGESSARGRQHSDCIA
ncbi:MauE/DoxX family redox-associated membrane protein [Desulfovibrio inopinatus]|uniref:MauE/DoxX family redox-associated membrane protein n=1 Tax=Desulfovibrio inopinatus TaxID=102109 RepID=UPI000425820F|nr:MauE/DoxX family redox-associated membrane protein [Desulfovibrio inopinatus]